jgi:hypothetical protein
MVETTSKKHSQARGRRIGEEVWIEQSASGFAARLLFPSSVSAGHAHVVPASSTPQPHPCIQSHPGPHIRPLHHRPQRRPCAPACDCAGHPQSFHPTPHSLPILKEAVYRCSAPSALGLCLYACRIASGSVHTPRTTTLNHHSTPQYIARSSAVICVLSVLSSTLLAQVVEEPWWTICPRAGPR